MKLRDILEIRRIRCTVIEQNSFENVKLKLHSKLGQWKE